MKERKGEREGGRNHSATAGFYHEWVGVSVRGTLVRADGLVSSYQFHIICLINLSTC